MLINTYRLWLRDELFRGRLTLISFDGSEQNLLKFINARGACGPTLFLVRSGWKPIEFEKGKSAIAISSLDKISGSWTRNRGAEWRT
jgi:hypothetical protein